jgi:hypothetical protein
MSLCLKCGKLATQSRFHAMCWFCYTIINARLERSKAMLEAAPMPVEMLDATPPTLPRPVYVGWVNPSDLSIVPDDVVRDDERRESVAD